VLEFIGAGNGIRTRDLQLGKQKTLVLSSITTY